MNEAQNVHKINENKEMKIVHFITIIYSKELVLRFDVLLRILWSKKR
jgi:hypothetical protein